jgi:hypothetical protein
MALNSRYINFIEQVIPKPAGDKSQKLRMLELGDQIIFGDDIPETTGKSYFENRGYDHTSVDLNGANGSIKKDLSKPEQFLDWHNRFDIITNSGTTEHIEPVSAQYEVFKIIHDCVTVGGMVVHLVPDVVEHDEKGLWKGHCPFFYSREFFDTLASECGYDLIRNETVNGLRAVAYIKTNDSPFKIDREMLCSGVAVREGGMSYGYTTLKGNLLLWARTAASVTGLEKPLKMILGKSRKS